MDPLTDVFTSMRVEGVLYRRIEATAPWGLQFDSLAHAKFGLVVRGSCWMTVEDQPEPLLLNSGDCYLLPHGAAHTLSDRRDRPTESVSGLAKQHTDVIHYGGGGEPTTLAGGKFFFNGPPTGPLTELLPRVIHVKSDQEGATALRTILGLLASEVSARRAGSEVVVSRLAEALFIQTVRAHLATAGCSSTGWLRGLCDPAIGAAIRAMHHDIARPWSAATLASEAGMSRSAFMLRFKELTGDTPLDYLTRWRMYQASRHLYEGRKKLFDVARCVGYDSEGSFSRAFKRVMGMTPGEYRRRGSGMEMSCGAVHSAQEQTTAAVS